MTTNISPISAGWNDVKQNWITPPGTNTDLVRKNLEDPNLAAQEFLQTIQFENRPLKEAARDQIDQQTADLFDIPTQQIKNFNKDLLAQTNPDVKRHIKGLLNATKADEFQGAFDGKYFRLNYQEAFGSNVNIIFDFKSDKTTNDNGLKIKGFWVTNERGQSINLLSIAPTADMYYHKYHWISWILAPQLNFADASASGNKINLLDMTFTNRGQGVMNPTDRILHESVHIKRFNNGKLHDDLAYPLTRATLSMADITSALLAIGISPWYLLPSIILNLYTYIASRDSDSAIGKSYHNLLIEESNAFFLQGVLSDLLTRKGFPTANMLGDMETLPDNFNLNFSLSYQPLSWGIIDSARFIANRSKKRKEEEKRQKETNTQTSFSLN